MHRKTLIATTLLAALATTAATAVAQDAAGPAARPARTQLDANGDGTIDKAEAAKAPRLAERFDRLDRDKDGRLGADERLRSGRHGPGHRGPHGMRGGIERLDADGDGRVSRAEFDAGKARREARRGDRPGAGHGSGKPAFDFAAADANRDGYLVRGELRAYGERMRPQREAERARRATERFAAADINQDGKLSRLEVGEKMPRLEKSFAWMDENRDGFLSQQELAPSRPR